MEQEIHFCATADGIRIAYATVGEGPPLVKAANWLNHLEFDWRSPIWRHLLEELARDHLLIRYDERGNGLSDWVAEDLSFDSFVRDLESVVDAAGLSRFPLLGISQGGAVAIAYAVRHPERVSHLILYGAYAMGWAKRGSAEEIERRKAQLTLTRLGWGQDNPAFRQLWTTLYVPDATSEQMEWFNDLQRVSTSPENAVRLFTEFGNLDVRDLLPQVAVPTLVLHCRDESVVPFEEGRRLAASIPGARFVPLEGRNHLLLENEPAWLKFITEARRFLGTAHDPARGKTAEEPRSDESRSLEGRLLGHYRILTPIGAGGMGEVYLAEDIRLDRKVGLKLLPSEFTKAEDRVRRFVQEAKAASALNHPNIITIYEVGEANGARYIVTEFIEGETLRRRIERSRMTIQQALDIGAQVASALAAAHTAGIVHRDIKPENIMLRPDGYIKVLDFGLAKLTERVSLSTDTSAPTVARMDTHPGMVMGTVSYMSPEQARGQTVDERSDIFSLGVVLYELVAGRAPFEGESVADVFVSILEKDPQPLGGQQADVPAELDRIVRRCLEKDRQRRYASAQELGSDLKSLASAPERAGGPSVREALASNTQALADARVADTAPSIAVLPFVNMSADPENEYFCDGLAEELLNSLSKIEALHVAARTSAFFFKGKETDISEIGQKLKVSTVLEGSVRKAGNRLRITAQLINVADGYHLWSERYDREMQDIFDIQDEISLAIVAALKVKLLGEEKAAVLKRYTDNTEAYQLYLKGRYHFGKWTEQGFRKAIEYFEQAIEKEPNYTLAFAGLAITYMHLWWFGYLSFDESEPKWNAATARAMVLDSALAEAHLAQAWQRFYQEWDFPEAQREFKRAIELNPNYGQIREQYGILLSVMGRADEAMAEASRALELDPVSLVTNLNVGWIFWCLGQYGRMREQGRKLLELDPNFFGGHWLMGVEAWAQGRYEQAISECQTAAALGGGTIVFSNLRCLYGIVGQREKARRALDELQELSAQRYVRRYDIALVYLGLGELDRAFERLEQAWEQREGNLIFLKHVALLIPGLSADPRLVDLLRRIGLPE